VVGGASANLHLRQQLEAIVARQGLPPLLCAPLAYCSDNAAMIGRCGVEAWKRKEFIGLEDVRVNPKVSF
jgi:N6-L-threonylcarbamoyladenine synthase